jgi:hypothetical protein
MKDPLITKPILDRYNEWVNESDAVSKHIYDALARGTSVIYSSTIRWDDAGPDVLYICQRECNGHKPIASDPLAQRSCLLSEPHFEWEADGIGRDCLRRESCYQPGVLDGQTASEVLRMPWSKGYDQMWGLTDDPEEVEF